MAETQDTGAATPAAPVSTAAAAVVTPVAAAAPAAAPAVAAAPAQDEQAAPDVKLRSRLNYSIGIELADGEHLSLPAHATRSITQAQAIDKDGNKIAVPRGVFIVEAQ